MSTVEKPSSSGRPPGGGADSSSSLWNPKVTRLYDYWRKIHPRTGLPGRQHFEPLDLPDLLPSLWLLDVQHEPFRLKFRLIGTRIVERLGREVTGQWLDEAHPHLANDQNYFERYHRVVIQKEPSWRKGPPLFKQDPTVAYLENLILPLAADGGTVNTLLNITILYTKDEAEY
jgi:hypothetical protein